MRDLLHYSEVVVDILSIECYLISVWVALVHSVAWVLHSKHVNLQIEKIVLSRAVSAGGQNPAVYYLP